MIPCQHRLRVIAHTQLHGERVDVMRCVLEGSCTLTPSLTKPDGQPIANCQHCTRQAEPSTQAQREAAQPGGRRNAIDCIHKGDVIRTEPCTLCGAKAGPKGTLVQISACALHLECAPSRYSSAQRPKSCATCEDYTSEPHKPA